MEYQICLFIGLAILGLTVLVSILFRKKKHIFYVLFGGVFVASFFMLLPIALDWLKGEKWCAVKAFLNAFHNTLRLFVVEGDYELVFGFTRKLQDPIQTIYAVFASILIVIAPMLTFGFVMIFFKTFFSYVRYLLHFFSETYVFTELNEKTLMLAKDLKVNMKHRNIVFTGIAKVIEEESELVEEARRFGAILFKRGAEYYNFSFHAQKKKLVFFASAEEAIGLCKKYGEREHTELYVFEKHTSGELILSSLTPTKMKIRRIHEEQALIQRFLYDEGMTIFDSAVECGAQKYITAMVVGMGYMGSHLAKTLPWFCQMDGYHFVMHLFSEKVSEIEKFAVECPELVDEKHNGNFDAEGEAQYFIQMHEAVEIESKRFWEDVSKIQDTSFIFVSLGTDERNIQTAVALRIYYEKFSKHPYIVTVVKDSDKKEALVNAKNYSGQAYDIHMIGDEQEFYSEKVLLHSDVEEVALGRHLKWGCEEEFWRFEYNYSSSIASAIHRKMKAYCGIPGVEKKKEERLEEEKWNLRKLEHRRWNAYMRAQGYTWAEKRNNLAKTHPCLVPFEELSLVDQEKDDD